MWRPICTTSSVFFMSKGRSMCQPQRYSGDTSLPMDYSSLLPLLDPFSIWSACSIAHFFSRVIFKISLGFSIVLREAIWLSEWMSARKMSLSLQTSCYIPRTTSPCPWLVSCKLLSPLFAELFHLLMTGSTFLG